MYSKRVGSEPDERLYQMGDNWTTVQDEAQIKFDADGDVFTGILNSMDVNGNIPQAHFTGTGDYKGENYFNNLGRDLERKLNKVPLGSEVRITRTGTLDTGQESPMVTYGVDHRPGPGSANTTRR
jgi:hypothetical protein